MANPVLIYQNGGTGFIERDEIRATPIGPTSGRCFYPEHQASTADSLTKMALDGSAPAF